MQFVNRESERDYNSRWHSYQIVGLTAATFAWIVAIHSTVPSAALIQHLSVGIVAIVSSVISVWIAIGPFDQITRIIAGYALFFIVLSGICVRLAGNGSFLFGVSMMDFICRHAMLAILFRLFGLQCESTYGMTRRWQFSIRRVFTFVSIFCVALALSKLIVIDVFARLDLLAEFVVVSVLIGVVLWPVRAASVCMGVIVVLISTVYLSRHAVGPHELMDVLVFQVAGVAVHLSITRCTGFRLARIPIGTNRLKF